MAKAPSKPAAKAPGKVEAKEAPATSVHVVGSCPILLDGDLYQPGDEIALTEAQAARLLKTAAVSAAAVESTPSTE